MKTKLITLLILFLFIASGCTKLPHDSMPDVGVPMKELNKQIYLYAPDGANSFKINKWITLGIRIVGKEKIWFPNDNGVRIFAYEDKQWIEIKNLADYSGLSDGIFLPYDGDPYNETSAGVLPDLNNNSRAITIRIFVIGNVISFDNITNTKTGAFIDVHLKP